MRRCPPYLRRSMDHKIKFRSCGSMPGSSGASRFCHWVMSRVSRSDRVGFLRILRFQEISQTSVSCSTCLRRLAPRHALAKWLSSARSFFASKLATTTRDCLDGGQADWNCRVKPSGNVNVVFMVEECSRDSGLSTDRREAVSYLFPAFVAKTSPPFLKSTVERLWSVTSPEMSWRESGVSRARWGKRFSGRAP